MTVIGEKRMRNLGRLNRRYQLLCFWYIIGSIQVSRYKRVMDKAQAIIFCIRTFKLHYCGWRNGFVVSITIYNMCYKLATALGLIIFYYCLIRRFFSRLMDESFSLDSGLVCILCSHVKCWKKSLQLCWQLQTRE